MDAKTLKALKGSIKKWEKIKAGTGIDDGVNNCSLCKLFGCQCIGCPVHEKTGSYCCGSPWDKWYDHHFLKHCHLLGSLRNKWDPVFPMKIECPICKKLAQAELQFLKSLLPKKQTKEKAVNKIMEQRKKAKEKLMSPKKIPK